MNPPIMGVTIPLRNDWCERCLAVVPVYLRRNVIASGADVIFEVCLLKNPHRIVKTGVSVSYKTVERWGVKRADIPVLENYARILCRVDGCAEVGVELHHWAPRSIFGEDADSWPTSELCLKHHREWHDRTKVANGKPPAGVTNA